MGDIREETRGGKVRKKTEKAWIIRLKLQIFAIYFEQQSVFPRKMPFYQLLLSRTRVFPIKKSKYQIMFYVTFIITFAKTKNNEYENSKNQMEKPSYFG